MIYASDSVRLKNTSKVISKIIFFIIIKIKCLGYVKNGSGYKRNFFRKCEKIIYFNENYGRTRENEKRG